MTKDKNSVLEICEIVIRSGRYLRHLTPHFTIKKPKLIVLDLSKVVFVRSQFMTQGFQVNIATTKKISLIGHISNCDANISFP